MKNTLIKFGCLLLIANFTYAQNPLIHKIDSLKTIAITNKNDSIKFNTYCLIAQTYWSFNPPEGISYAKKALELAKKINTKDKLSEAYGILGMNYELLLNHKEGLVNLKKSLSLAKEINDQKRIALASGALGNVYYFQTNYPMAIDYYLQSLKACDKTNDKRAMAAALSNIGAIYMDLEELDKAQEYFEKALKINTEIGFKLYQAINLSNISSIQSKKKQHKAAIETDFKALKISKEINEMGDISGTYTSIAGDYFALKKIDSAYYYLNLALPINRQIKAFDNLSFDYHLMAKILFKAYDENNLQFISKNLNVNKSSILTIAKAYADSSLEYAIKSENLDRQKIAYEILSKIQNASGKCSEALISYNKFNDLKDSIYQTEINKKLTQKTMQYEFDKLQTQQKIEQAKKDAIADAEKEKSKQQKIVLIFGLFVAVGFAVWDYRQKKIISKEKKRSEDLLLNILPHEVAEELKAKGNADAQLIDEVTVLFTDFKGFTQLSEKLSPKELVAEINECFSAFDYIMEKHSVEKIKTIGDAYMAAGGLPTANNTHAENVVNAALEIQTFMQEHKAKKLAANELFFEIRIGVHTGPVVAGIVGVKKFAYDIWGDTVNTASRMESSGEVGKVNISGTTYDLVKDKFNCVHRGKVQAKGKGEIDMYFVE
jgi:class 3 adenylate cyclase